MIKTLRHTLFHTIKTFALFSALLIALFIALSVSVSNPLYAAADEIVNFNIPSQTLNEALIELSTQSGIQIFYTDVTLSSIMAPQVIGPMTTSEAISGLLAGSGYIFEFTNTQTIRIFTENANLDSSQTISEQLDDENSDDNPDNQVRSRIYEIVTTSQQRLNGKNLQDLPVSISVLPANELQNRNITNVRQLNENIPNLNIRGGGVTGSSVGTFAIRGVPGVIRYLDGVAQPSNIGALFNILELESIEVIKGPQGTLFGKNALGGTIRYTSKKPSSDFGARLNIRIGNFGYNEVSTNIDIPVTDSFLTKFTAARISKDGYVSSGAPGVFYGDEKDTLFRIQGNWQPGSDLEINMSAALNRSSPDFQQANVLYDVLENHENVQLYNDAGFQFTDTSDAFGKYQQYQTSSLYSGPGNFWDEKNFALNGSWNFRPGYSLVFISGKRHFEWGNYADLDASRYAYFEQWRFTLGDESSQEIQLRGNYGSMDWTTGIYYSSNRYVERQTDWKYEEISPTPRNELAHTSSTDRAFFAEATYSITDRLSSTMGIRYSVEDFRTDLYSPLETRPPWQQITFNTAAGTLLASMSDSHKTITPRYSIQFDWNTDIMTYLTYTEGFNGGGINDELINNQLLPYYGETLKQYEFGIRSDFMDHKLRFNAAYFTGNWEDIQVGEVITPGIFTIINAGKANIEGLDADIVFSVTDQLRLNFSAGILDSAYSNIGRANTINIDSLLALAPDKSFYLGGTYFLTLGNGDFIDLNLGYGWMDKLVSVSDVRLQDIQHAYGLLNAQILYSAASEKWNISLFGNNLTDEWFQLGGFSASLAGITQGVVARPREVGISLSMKL